MYVTSMLIDGFKSYGQRTEVQGFDPLFNAITGLNGSGKSNILDGICFVLGITNLSHVRATNLQELVYKNGQAGVTRAIVSITFNNSDKAQSPLGYEQYDEITITRQVVVGGRNKYAINGVNVQNSRVQDMFRSVKLNVNNPHFLIMQGRITKVLNMKPPEILSMIEEAAGTRLYESKKQSAIKTIEKKDAKLKEISDIVDEEISPTMTKLKQEKAVCLEFQKIQREYDHLKKFCIACKYVSLQKRCEQLQEDETKIKTAITDARNTIKENKCNTEKLEQDIHRLQLQRDNEAGGALKSLEEALDQRVKSEAKCCAALKGVRDNLKAEERKKTALEKGMEEDRAALGKKEQLLSGMQQLFDQLRSTAELQENQLAEAQQRYQAISAGLSTDADGQSATLAQHMMNAKASLAEAETAHKQASMRHKHAKQDLTKRSAALKTTDAEFKRDKSKLDKMKADVEQMQKNMADLGFDECRVDELDQQRRQLTSQLTGVQEDVDRVLSKFPQLAFDYRDPEPNFDRSAICGPVARLLTLTRPDTATALEVTAGGKLHNIVVKTEVVGKKLLERGQLQRRVTFIPLNQIVARGIDDDMLRRAEKLVGKENVCTALSCISYDQEVHKAMVWVFGSTFICKDLDCAKKVAFDSRIQRRAVTLDGDVVDPAGTLTGGSRSCRQSMLEQLHSAADSFSRVQQLEKQLLMIQGEIRQMEPNRDRYQRLKQQQELRSHELNLLEERVQQSSHCQLQQELQQLQQQIDELEQAMASSLETQQQEKQKVRELEEQLRDQKSTRDRQLKQAETDVKQCRGKAETARQAWHAKQEDEEKMKLEIADLRSSAEQAQQQISAVMSSLELLAQQLTESEQEATQAKTALSEAKADVKRQKEVLSSQNREISQLSQQRDQLAQTSKQSELEIMKLDHQLEKIRVEATDSTETSRRMMEDHEWIAADRRFFGQPGTSYDFSAMDASDAARRVSKLDEHRSKLGKSVNMRAMKMLDKAEEQYNDLMRKKRIVENDKAKIERFIEELDDKKNDALKKAWLQVNKDFGSIFSTLLPGTSAKLQPPEGQGVLDGLEVRVAFGDVWKDSLSELSGGQRSLVALSLILALLLFKPAPIYILDEVDAALDLSHTQNIGTMLRTHFKHSQFIVVSLKDGMFNNANVLFKTKFVDGMSTVARFTQHVPLGSRN